MTLTERIPGGEVRDRRTRRRLERANEVYLAAVGLFVERGYDATTMDEIAERADVARGSVFNYFPRKVLFLEEWGSRRRHQAVSAARLEHVEDDPIGDVLVRYFDGLARVSEESRTETVSLMAAAVTSSNLLNEPLLGHDLAAYVARARDGGELRPGVDAEQVGLLLATGYFATLCRWIAAEPAPFDLRCELRNLLDIVLGGIAAR